jgi:DNA mismatch repair ATPase MutL
MHAIKSFFQDKQLLGLGLYPAYVLYLTINPEDVDVNVHPTKHEVRFHEPRLIHDFITTALSEVLTKTGLLAEIIEIEEEQEEKQAFKLAFNPQFNSDFNSELPPAFKSNFGEEHHIAENLAIKSTSKITPVFFKKPSDLSCSFVQDAPQRLSPMIKIGQYLLLIKIGQYLLFGESIEQSGQGRMIDLKSAQADILAYFLSQSASNWFVSKPLLVPLSISTRYTEQWLWPERQHFFETQFGLLYQFKQKNEVLVTHLPQIAKYLTHEERTKHLSCLFELALHNGQVEWQKAMGQFFPAKFLCRLLLEEWKINSAILEDWGQKSFCRTIESDFLAAFLNKAEHV